MQQLNLCSSSGVNIHAVPSLSYKRGSSAPFSQFAFRRLRALQQRCRKPHLLKRQYSINYNFKINDSPAQMINNITHNSKIHISTESGFGRILTKIQKYILTLLHSPLLKFTNILIGWLSLAIGSIQCPKLT